MAHFAELDKDNKVLRVVVGCNTDIANNGGEQSTQAATHFETVVPLSANGVKWVQTSYNHNFRKQYAGKGYIYDSAKDKFLNPQPFSSWSLDGNDDWQAPVAYPTITTYDGDKRYFISWNEENLRWVAKDEGVWNTSTESYDTEPANFNWDASALAWVSA